MGLADTDPITISKQNDLAVHKGLIKADLATFDREKFYSRLGINPDAPDEESLIEDVKVNSEVKPKPELSPLKPIACQEKDRCYKGSFEL